VKLFFAVILMMLLAFAPSDALAALPNLQFILESMESGCRIIIPSTSSSNNLEITYRAFDSSDWIPLSPDNLRVDLLPRRYFLRMRDTFTQEIAEYPVNCIRLAISPVGSCTSDGALTIQYTAESIDDILQSVNVTLVSNGRLIASHTNIGTNSLSNQATITGLPFNNRFQIQITAIGNFGDGRTNANAFTFTCPALPPPPTPDPISTPVPVSLAPQLVCPPNTTAIPIINSPREVTIGAPVFTASFSLPVDDPSGSLVVASMVGHPEAGCPGGNSPLCTQSQDNEEFNIYEGAALINFIPDHGENQWKQFPTPYPLSAGEHELRFQHTQRAGNNPFGSVSILAA
jgi:hypothetical protein